MGTKKICQNPDCQKPLRRRKGESRDNYWKRQNCDKKCYLASKNGVTISPNRPKYKTSRYELAKVSKN
jgi:hypothetical protein